ncbi:MAG TPA: type II toxin-antitoxin system MqsR family toxin [Longimicrobiaceae bacterium]|nr:type II toxin-antitoxin system MqsR family toxin [Longimicrobiaceae bacterium]
MPSRRIPTYPLGELQRLVLAGQYVVTYTALSGAAELEMDAGDIREAVLGLTVADFYKTMEAEAIAGRWQDVYRPMYEGVWLYVKLQLSRDGRTVVIQFKRK